MLKEAVGKVYGLLVVFKKWPELKKLKENLKTVLSKEVDYIFTLEAMYPSNRRGRHGEKIGQSRRKADG